MAVQNPSVMPGELMPNRQRYEDAARVFYTRTSRSSPGRGLSFDLCRSTDANPVTSFFGRGRDPKTDALFADRRSARFGPL